MHIYIPYASRDLAEDHLDFTIREMQLVPTIEYLGRPRIRNAAPGMDGIPHQHFKVTMRPEKDSDIYRKFSLPVVADGNPRRVNAVCWHAYKNFMNTHFSYYDDSTIRTAVVEYNGQEDFFSKYARTKLPFYFNQHSGIQLRGCLCRNGALANWESDSHNFEF